MPDDGPAIAHIGWDLWRASQAWKSRFVKGMVERGHDWFAEARGNLIHLIAAEGTRQSDIVLKSQLTKQAVQQFLDELERDGIIKRTSDPGDARAKRVSFTGKGRRVLDDANSVKREIEAEYEERLGKPAFTQLKSALDKLASASDEQA